PAVDCILMARPTKSQTLYTQCVGRGLRRCDVTGKADCLILDVTDNCRRHKLITATSLLGDGRTVAAVGTSTEAEQHKHARRPDIRRHTNLPVVWRLDEVPPWPSLPDLEHYSPRFWWQNQPATEKQLGCLCRFGLDVTRELTKG